MAHESAVEPVARYGATDVGAEGLIKVGRP